MNGLEALIKNFTERRKGLTEAVEKLDADIEEVSEKLNGKLKEKIRLKLVKEAKNKQACYLVEISTDLTVSPANGVHSGKGKFQIKQGWYLDDFKGIRIQYLAPPG